jgi:hypothetical protein
MPEEPEANMKKEGGGAKHICSAYQRECVTRAQRSTYEPAKQPSSESKREAPVACQKNPREADMKEEGDSVERICSAYQRAAINIGAGCMSQQNRQLYSSERAGTS